MADKTSIAVHGASGRMGRAVLDAALTREDVRIAAALVRADSALAGTPLARTFGERAPDLSYSIALARDARVSVLIDFSVVSAFDAALAAALDCGSAFVSGTTGLSAEQRAAMDHASATIPVLWSANFSLGIAVLTRLVREAARALPYWDCEIAETHHRHKIDAPSGTALALGRAVADARGAELEAVSRYPRAAGRAREPGEIGYAVARAGDVVGEHTVTIAGDGERIELVHRAQSRDVFARGALEAALWLAGRPARRYALDDVIAP